MFGLFYPYGIVLQAIAIVHFARRRADTYWLLDHPHRRRRSAPRPTSSSRSCPTRDCCATSFQVFPRRSQIKELQAAIIDNPSIGNYEELGDLYLEDGQLRAGARMLRQGHRVETPTRPIPSTAGRSPNWPSTIRQAAVTDLEEVYRSRSEVRLSARGGAARARPGQDGDRRSGRAEGLRRRAASSRPLSETQYNYARALAEHGQKAEAQASGRERMLRKKLDDALVPSAPGAPVVQQSYRRSSKVASEYSGDGRVQPTSTQFSVRSTAFCHP